MKYSWKGALFSGLIFPGLGQIVLKRYKRGIALMLTVLASLSIIVLVAVENALAILDKIESEGGAISMSNISSAAAQVSTTSTDLMSNLLLLLVLICWVFATVDAYRTGQKMDVEKIPHNQSINGEEKRLR